MGASAWIYFVPFEPGFDEALAELRRTTFVAGDFVPPYPRSVDDVRELTDGDVRVALAEEFGIDPAELGFGDDSQIATFMPVDETDRRIVRMLVLTMDMGSHSILDMSGVGTEPGFGVVAPLTDVELDATFGTRRPTREQIEGSIDALYGLRNRWEGSLVTVYDDQGNPIELCFVGFSGD